jgi:hypothetical protein
MKNKVPRTKKGRPVQRKFDYEKWLRHVRRKTSNNSNLRFHENYYSLRGGDKSLANFSLPRRPSVKARPLDTPPPTLEELLSWISADLTASDALFQQRKYFDAFFRLNPGGPTQFAGYSHVFEEIRRWLVGGGQFVPELQDDAKRAGLGGSECLHALQLYLPAAQSFFIVATGNPIPIPLTDTDIAYIWLRWSTVALDWGDALFRNTNQFNNQLSAASDIYQSVVQVVNSVPSVPDPQTHPSPLYQIASLKPAADAAVKIIQNLNALITGTTTSEALGVNPVQAAVIIEIYQQVVKIQSGLDFWGHSHNTVPIWSFEYLQNIAINFTQLAISAERDFINFQDRNDQAQFTRQQLVQMTFQANAEVDAAGAQTDVAKAELVCYQDGASLADQRALDAQKNAGEYAAVSDLAIQYQATSTVISGGDNADVNALNNEAATLLAYGIGSLFEEAKGGRGELSGAYQLSASRLNRQYEVDSLQRTAVEMGLAATQAQDAVTVASAKVTAAMAAQAVARLHAVATQQNLQAFDSQTFTPDVWQRMAETMWRLYRRYLGMGLKTALLMQQAYNFETDQALQFIKSDYSTDEVKGLLGADALMADIQSFTYDLITSTKGKIQPIRQSISLAQDYAFAFERQFRKTGVMEFETRIDDFDYLYPGTYAGRIENVEVEVVGIVPSSGISGTLTNSGISGYRTPASAATPGTSGLKYRLQSKETLVLSDYAARNDSQLIPGNPGMMRIFQGAGVVSTWKFELPKEINDIDYGALLDVRLTFYYKARYDPELHALVIQELASRPGINARQRGIPLRWLYPDAFFHFQDTGQLAISLKASDFRTNETKPILDDVGVVVATDGSVPSSGIAMGLGTPGHSAVVAVTDTDGKIDSGSPGSAWVVLLHGPAVGDYVITVDAANNPALVKNGVLDLSPIVNIALVLGYTFTPKK